MSLSLLAEIASAQDVPATQQAIILIRAIAYDRNLTADAGATVDVVVVHRSGHASAQAAEKAAAAFRSLEKNTVAGLPIRVALLPYDTVAALGPALVNAGADVAYVPAGLDDDVDGIVTAMREKKITSVAGRRAYLDRGVALGVFIVGERPTIFVNVPASQAEGAAFSSDLFKIARAIR